MSTESNEALGGHCLLPQNETKRREILCDLALLLGAAAGAQGQVSDECGARQLSQLYRHANSFFLLLQTFSWEVRPPNMSQTTGQSCQLGWVQWCLSPLCPTLRQDTGSQAAPHTPWSRPTSPAFSSPTGS